MNLILNARDAITGSGTIRVRTDNLTIDCNTSLAGYTLRPKCGDYVSLKVTDNGSGIAPEVIHKLFEPFFSTKGPEKGTGLGLAVVHGIIRQNCGGLLVESQPHQGTTITLLIPVARESVSGVGNEPIYGDPMATHFTSFSTNNSECILLVDDDPAVCQHTEHVLKRLGYHVTTANSAEDALALVTNGGPTFQLLITDYSMPGMSGLELTKQIALRSINLPVILMSGFLNEDAFRSIPEGLNPLFIQKPFAIHDLASSIRKALKIAETTNRSAPVPLRSEGNFDGLHSALGGP